MLNEFRYFFTLTGSVYVELIQLIKATLVASVYSNSNCANTKNAVFDPITNDLCTREHAVPSVRWRDGGGSVKTAEHVFTTCSCPRAKGKK